MTEWLEGMEPQWVWLIAAALLAVAEMIVPGVFLIWLAAAAALTGIATLLFGLPLAGQLGLFAVLSLVAFMAGRRWYRQNPVDSEDPLLNDRAARLVGETVVVVSPIENGRGRVSVRDTVWNAAGADAEIGARVRVTGSEGNCLKVEPLA
jgi:membrane protein implicated in regulation of membrane protease activity